MATSVSPFLSLIIPAYRQAATICPELLTLKRFLKASVPSFEIILVIDGNEDGTLEKVSETISFPELRVECFTKNHGKGAAVRHGLLLARGELVAFMDAGGDLKPEDLKYMVDELQQRGADIVMGSKRHTASRVAYPWRRRLYSFAYQMFNRLFFQLSVRDTQVGLKVFRREVLQAILPRLQVKRFAFDLELLVVARHLGFSKIIEAPITIQHTFSSSINWQAVYQTLWDTLAILYRSRITGSYDRDHDTSSASPPVFSPIVVTQHIPAREPEHASVLTSRNRR